MKTQTKKVVKAQGVTAKKVFDIKKMVNISKLQKLIDNEELGNMDYNPMNIKYTKCKPSEKHQLIAVEYEGVFIRYIINKGIVPSEKVQLAAVSDNGIAIKYIKNPSERVQLAAVKNNSDAIEFIDNPSEEVQLAAVKNDGYAIADILKKGIVPSEKVQLAAVMEKPSVIKFIMAEGIIPSEKILKRVLTYGSDCIEYFDNPSAEFIMFAVKCDENVLDRIDENFITKEIKLVLREKGIKIF